VRIQWFSRVLIGFVSLLSIGIFCWPILVGDSAGAHAGLAQAIFMGLMPVLVAITLIEFSSGGIDSRQIALLGVLIALNSVVRMLGAGTAGIETAFFLILIGAYVFGASFGYLLGSGSLLVSALLTGGVGPWLPFQMMAAGLIGVMAGLLPRPASKRLQLVYLCLAAVVGSYLYGALMTMWNWPFLAGTGTSLSYIAGGGIGVNVARFVNFEIVTGGLLWDTGRAVTTCILVMLTAPALLATLKRAARKAGYQRR
jgi:energy-coupling factor transport system substrate-specific component